jgi:phage tail-like protein
VSAAPERSYRFQTENHWRAGIWRGLQVQGNRLVVPAQLALRPLPGTIPTDTRILPAFDVHRRLMWLSSGTGAVMRWHPSEDMAVGLGATHGATRARRLVAGPTLLWVVSQECLLRHDAATLQRLTPSQPVTGWRLSDATGDGQDGLWTAETNDAGRGRLRHVNCWGQTCREPLHLETSGARDLALSATDNGSHVYAIDPVDSAELWVVDVIARTSRRIALDEVHLEGRTLLATGPGDRVHLLTVPARFGRNTRIAVLQTLDPRSGFVENHQLLEIPPSLGRPAALAGCPDGLALACADGIAELTADTTSSGSRWATFITPALVSPRRPRSGWDRAEIEAELPSGTTMSVTWVSEDEDHSVERTTGSLGLPTALATTDGLDRATSWRSPATTFHGADGPARRHGVLLDTVKETTLWLRLDLHVAAGSPSPALIGLRVGYPDSSYLDYLPAIYREHPRAAQELRQILAPYEALLDDIDETLDSMPDRIRPNTASEEWTDYLLSWLGFPPLGELPVRARRGLLAQAPEILDYRGTKAGLERVLKIVTDGGATVTDSSDEPVGWFLGTGTPASAGAGPSRLGVDTVALDQRPQQVRTGALVLGGSRLGPVCPEPTLTLAQHAQTITIDFRDDLDEQVLRAVIDRILDAFVPAHCRVVVRWSTMSQSQGGRLDVGFRLGPDAPVHSGDEDPVASLLDDIDPGRLGASTHLGRWPLPAADPIAVLDRDARLNIESRLL